MSNNEGSLSCAQGSWLLALGAGIIAAALLMVVGDWRLIQAIFALVVIAIILGALLSWLVCKPMSAPGELPRSNTSEKPVLTSKESAAAAAAQAREGVEPPPQTPPAAAAAAAKAGVKPTRELSGEAELAARKGTWKYQAEGASSAPAAKPAAATGSAAPAAEVSDADAPERLSAARGDGPDDLKQIKGVGPKLEKLLNSMGFFHFDQIAAWTPKEVAWVDENLEGFKGRVSRDNWVEQAKTLAEGGATEFSSKVRKGDVY